MSRVFVTVHHSVEFLCFDNVSDCHMLISNVATEPGIVLLLFKGFLKSHDSLFMISLAFVHCPKCCPYYGPGFDKVDPLPKMLVYPWYCHFRLFTSFATSSL